MKNKVSGVSPVKWAPVRWALRTGILDELHGWREGIILVSEFADELGRRICHVDLRE